MSPLTSISMVAGVTVPSSKPVAYMTGLNAEPDCR